MSAQDRSSIAQRATRPHLAAVDAQDGLFDQVIEDADLAEALEERERKRAPLARAKGEYEDANDTAKAKLDALGLGNDTVVRCGRFRIKISPPGESTPVAYDTVPRRTTTITLLEA